MKASVPGNVHHDLYLNKQIKHPYYGTNEATVKWVEAEDWEYEQMFSVSQQVFNQVNVELVFEGLDTYAEVYLNDSLLLKADNMFRTWRCDVKTLLKQTNNRLYILFRSPLKIAQAEMARLPYKLPEGERVFARKAQYHYGWDWGPRLLTCGIWKSVGLRGWHSVLLESLNYRVRSADSAKAVIDIVLKTNCKFAAGNHLCFYKLGITGLKKPVVEQGAVLTFGIGPNTHTLTMVVPAPRLWWCNGMGEAFLYNLDLELPAHLEKTRVEVCIKTLELVQEPDSIGSSFYFKLNGKPVFIKGANYIPPDIFYPNKGKAYFEELVASAKNANMNMLRVWGGGVYAPEEFYETCSRQGLLVWQDFMFACAMYPGDSKFVNNASVEAREQVSRLGKYACLALWCGNNENEEGWYNWGWQKQLGYSAADSAKIWKDYVRLFHDSIPAIVLRSGIGQAYWPSSPSKGWGRKESLTQGDLHYWGVWWGMEPFSVYRTKTGRFVSEYGFQGMPELSSFRKFCDANQLRLGSEQVKAHQKHPRGFETINTYMGWYYKVPSDFEKYIYVSQLLQRDAVKTAIDAHRKDKRRCMGSLLWQLNDCWPVTSWSIQDYYGRRKAAYYGVKQSFSTFHVQAEETVDGIRVIVNSDSLHSVPAKLLCQLKDFSGKLLFETSSVLNLTELASIFKLNRQSLPDFDTASVYLHAALTLDGKILASQNYYFGAPKNLKLPPARLKITTNAKGQCFIQSDVLARDVYVYADDGSIDPEDNFFDLQPGEQKQLQFKSKPGKGFPATIKYLVLNNL